MELSLKHQCQFCSACPYHNLKDRKNHYIPTDVRYTDKKDDRPNIQVLIVGAPVSRWEDTAGLPFVDQGGKEVRNIIKQLGLHFTVAYSNCVRCFSKGTPVNTEIFNVCRNYILEDIKYLQPKVVLLVGAQAFKCCPSKEWAASNLTAKLGEPYVEDGVTYLAVMSPDTFLQDPEAEKPVNKYSDKKRFMAVVEKIPQLLTGKKSVFSKKGYTQLLTTVQEVEELVDLVFSLNPSEMEEIPGIAVDTETQNLYRIAENKLATIQIALDNNTGFVIPILHKDSPFKGEDLTKVEDLMRKLFGTHTEAFSYWNAFNAKFDRDKLMRHLGINIAMPMLDSYFLEFLTDEDYFVSGGKVKGQVSPFTLKSLARSKLDFQHYSQEVLQVRGNDEGLFNMPLFTPEGGPSKFADYSAMDAYVTRRIACVQLKDLQKQGYNSAVPLALKWENRVNHLYVCMERNGLYADKEQMEYLKDPVKSPIITRLKEIPGIIKASPEGKDANEIIFKQEVGNIHTLFGTPQILDINKVDHKIALLVDACGLEPISYGKNGKASIDKKYYEKYKDHEIIELYQDYTQLKTLHNGYIDSMLRDMQSVDNIVDGRIHASYHATRAVTGRSSASDPNLQKIPHESDEHPEKSAIKSMLGAAPGNLIVEMDYGQSEVRWWCQIAGDEVFADMFKNMAEIRKEFLRNPTPEGRERVKLECDVHRQVGALMHRIKLSEITKAQRQGAKSIVFGSIFGQHYTTLAKKLKIEDNEAKKLQTKFLTRFKKAGDWLFDIETFAEKHHYVDSPFGRRRHLDSFFAFDPNRAKRIARNSPVQGASADNMLLQAWRFQRWLEENKLTDKVKIVNAVHDAIMIECPIDTDIVRLAVTELERCMVDVDQFLLDEFGIKMIVPMEVDSKAGIRWGHCMGLEGVTNVEEVVEKCRVQDLLLKEGKKFYEICGDYVK